MAVKGVVVLMVRRFLENPYRTDLNDPWVRTMYDWYRDKIGVPKQYPLSDGQRTHFDQLIFKILEVKRKSNR